MNFPRRPLLLALALVFASGAAAITPTPAPLKATPLMQEETRMVVSLLETVHYLNAPINNSAFEKLITNFMSELDEQRLFFTSADERSFLTTYGPTLGRALREEGRLDVAFRIFSVYRTRVEARVGWVLAELEKDIDLTADEDYLFDRKNLGWPGSPAEADELWRKRLKFELLPDVLNDKTLDEAKETIGKRYDRLGRNVAEIESPEVQEIFLSTFTRMFDPHSTFFSAETLEDFSISMRLSLVGIGALLSSEDGQCVIKELIPGGPAILSRQINVNDKIVAVTQGEGEPVDVIGMNLRKVVNMIRGEKGTPITLTVIPADATDIAIRKLVTLTRDVVQLNASRASASIHEVPVDSGGTMAVGVIDVPSFYGAVDEEGPAGAPSSSVTADVEELLGKLKRAGVQGVVLDLRRNGGGLLGEAVDLTGLFIPKGPVVLVRNSYGQIENKPDTNAKVAYAGPLVVLTSRYSASASEIVAGALQNYGRAIIVGDRSTHGKGTVQAVLEMKTFLPRQIFTAGKAGATKLTVQKFYLPNGSSTQNKGVIPDVSLPAIEDFLPIGESDLPNSLAWDTIGGVRFNGRQLDDTLRAHLNASAAVRIGSLDEFAFLQQRIDWLRAREDMKAVPLALEKRRTMKTEEKAFRDAMKTRQDELAVLNYPTTEVKLDSTLAAGNDAPTLDELVESDEAKDAKAFDIHLRESLRILRDAIAVAPDPATWSERAAMIAALTPASEKSLVK